MLPLFFVVGVERRKEGVGRLPTVPGRGGRRNVGRWGLGLEIFEGYKSRKREGSFWRGVRRGGRRGEEPNKEEEGGRGRGGMSVSLSLSFGLV